jgi:serine/threonine-protein kinase
VGHYEILGLLGKAWPAAVYRARFRPLDRVVALKVLLTDDDADRQRFLREARAMAALEHPHIVRIHEVGEDRGCPFIAMQLVEGDLARQLARGIPATGEVALLIARLAQAVHHVHCIGLVHRDLKPANVLIDADGTPYLTGFWLARPPGGHSRPGVALGTPPYMAPEQVRGDRGITPAVDVYGLGAVLYECLTGRPPFAAATFLETIKQVVESEPPAPRRVNPQASEEIAAVALKCLEKDPGKRYASAAEVAAEMERFLRGDPVRARPRGAVRRVLAWVRGG